MPDEASLEPLIKAAWDAGKQTYLPILQADRTLLFAHYSPETRMQLNPFGISEPAEPVIAEQLDWVICPLVAFDIKGSRIGQGAGYYDRSFGQPLLAETTRIGVAFECQKSEKIPADPWDQPLNKIVTECRIYTGS